VPSLVDKLRKLHNVLVIGGTLAAGGCGSTAARLAVADPADAVAAQPVATEPTAPTPAPAAPGPTTRSEPAATAPATATPATAASPDPEAGGVPGWFGG